MSPDTVKALEALTAAVTALAIAVAGVIRELVKARRTHHAHRHKNPSGDVTP